MPHFEMTPDDLMGQLTDTFGTLLESPKPNALNETQARDRRGIKRYLRPTSKDDARTGHTGPSTREPAPGSSSAGYLHPPPSTGNIEHPPVHPAEHLRMEEGSRTAECQPISSPKAHHHDHLYFFWNAC